MSVRRELVGRLRCDRARGSIRALIDSRPQRELRRPLPFGLAASLTFGGARVASLAGIRTVLLKSGRSIGTDSRGTQAAKPVDMVTESSARLVGAIWGTAVGDSLGLPFEGMSRRRVLRTMGTAAISHRFLVGRGMVSDDTEHTCLVAHALATSHGDVNKFENALAWSFRWWLLGLPAGVGLGTLRALIRLWLGFGVRRSGVWSAGNGPAMRAAIIGAYAPIDSELRASLVRASTRITHSDPRAELGALAVANAAAIAAHELPATSHQRIDFVRRSIGDCELATLLSTAADHAEDSTAVLAEKLGLQRGVSGFVNHTVPVAIHVWARHPDDFERAIEEVVRLGGDTDTTAAIVGGLVGTRTGPGGIPTRWRDGLWEWPRSIRWMEQLGEAVAANTAPPSLNWPGTYVRNALFTLGVYGLILRRALPPY